MKELIIFIAGLIVGTGLTLVFKKNGKEPLSAVNRERVEQKEKNKQKILEFLTDKDEVVNDDVESLIKVSNATAERYLDELEKEDHLKQMGKVGRSVKYKVLK